MIRSCAFNELSLVGEPDIKELLTLAAVLQEAGSRRLVVPGARLGIDPTVRLWDAIGRLDKVHRDERLKLLKTRLDRCPVDDTVTVRYQGRIGLGLRLAWIDAGLALSLSLEAWDKTELDIEIERDGAAPITHRLQHASTLLHVAEHLPVGDRTPTDALRIALERRSSQHIKASRYDGGKHVRGQNNNTRAREAAFNGQFLAEINGVPVDDETIASWERAALDAIRAGQTIPVEAHGTGFFVMFRHADVVGYAAPHGIQTQWVRVEWSSGTVHSHPIGPRADAGP